MRIHVVFNLLTGRNGEGFSSILGLQAIPVVQFILDHKPAGKRDARRGAKHAEAKV